MVRAGGAAVRCAVVVLAWFVFLSSPAHAQRRGAVDPEQAARDKAAREHYSKGILHYDLGEIDEAIAEFRQAYAISAAPGLLFNIAQAYRFKKDYEQALQVANDTPYGLSSGIVTTSLKHATHFRRNAESGLVMVNLPTAGLDYHVPFGGRKKSSYGPREQGSYAREFYTVVKTAYVST